MKAFGIQLIAKMRSYSTTFRVANGPGIVDYALVIALLAVPLVGALAQVSEATRRVVMGMLNVLVSSIGG